MTSSNIFGPRDVDASHLVKSGRPPRMGMAEIMARTALSRLSHSPSADQIVALPSDLLEIDMPDETVVLSRGLSVTFSTYDFFPDMDSASDVKEFSLPDDLIFFYCRGVMSRTDSIGGRESLLRLLWETPFVFVLQVDKNLPVPQDWISTLENLESAYPQKFRFVCVNAKMQSTGMLYINGKLDSFFELAHTGNYIAHGDLLRRMLIKRINLSLDVPRRCADTRERVSLVMNGGGGCRGDYDADSGEVAVTEVMAEPNLSLLPKADDRTINGWLGSGVFRVPAR